MLWKIVYAIIGFFFLKNLFEVLWSWKHPEYGITFIAGEIGAGKSTLAAKYAKKAMKRGVKVYSTDYIKGCYKLNVADLETKVCPDNSLLIIDEASLKMNSRSFAKTQICLIEYFKMCRHYRNNVIMISQTFGDTDKQIRELSSKVFFVRKIINGFISMPVRVVGKLGIGQDGQPCVMYEIRKLGLPYFLPLYYKMFKSFNRTRSEYVADEKW